MSSYILSSEKLSEELSQILKSLKHPLYEREARIEFFTRYITIINVGVVKDSLFLLKSKIEEIVLNFLKDKGQNIYTISFGVEDGDIFINELYIWIHPMIYLELLPEELIAEIFIKLSPDP